MNRLLQALGFGLLGVGLAWIGAAAAQAFGGVALFRDPPWTVGGGLATIGGLIAGASRAKR